MDKAALMSSAEGQLRSYGEFLNENDKKLHKLLDKVAEVTHSNKISHDPLLIELDYASNNEKLSLMQLLECDRLLNKTLLTFAHLSSEIDAIVKNAKCMQKKFLYLDEELCVTVEEVGVQEQETKTSQSKENILLKMSLSIQFLCEVNFLLQRCIVLGNNLLHQCCALLGQEGSTSEFNLFNVFDSLANLLLQLLIFDEILVNSNFQRYWETYKKTVVAIARSRSLHETCSASEINGLITCLQEMDFLFAKLTFRSFLDSIFILKDKVSPKGMGHLMQQCNEYMKYNLALLDKSGSFDLNDFSDPHSLVRLNAFCVVFHDFCGQVEGKHLRHLLELNAKHQGIILAGNVLWLPLAFLRRHAETLIKSHEKYLYDTKRQQNLFLQARLQSLQRDCRSYCSQVSLWTLNVNRSLAMGAFELSVGQFKQLGSLLLLGLGYAGQISFLVKAMVNLHVALQVPMTKPTLLAVCKLIEMLKSLQTTFREKGENVAKIIQCILQYLQYKVLHLLALSKKKVISSSKIRDRNVDALAAFKIAEKCMHGPPSRTRIMVAKLAVSATNANNAAMAPDVYEKFNSIMQRIELLSNIQRNLEEVCDTSFLHWHQSIFTAYLRQVVDRRMDFQSFQKLAICANNCGKALNSLQLGDLRITDLLKRSNYENLRNEIISHLCAQIETFLRLEVHSNIQLEKMSPFDQGINDYRDLINTCPIEVNGSYVILKEHVENYLGAMFYNLTTISLHDWKTYEEMRHLANIRLDLKPVEDYLPNQTLEQGVDILEIMRNIHIFVSTYVYNMNSQIFVEQKSANKHLDTIGIRHVANSVRTHGSGVISTTVNFTYQFLRQKFYTFSQFLYDEQIKSRLMKELRSFAERKQNDNYPLYPYERAEAFNKDIRKLGLSSDDLTYMDLFRKVITQVGNAMGYIRLVRSGSIHANYSASLYLPKFEETLQFADQCREQQLHEVTIAAAENVEINISNLVKSFSDSTDYFKLLVEAFRPFFQNPHNLHLKNFFLIVPPLIVNYVEHMLKMKEKINKKDRHEAILFDDGFAVGLAYILKLLDQISDFNALQWFTTVRNRFDAERLKIKQMVAEIQNRSKSGNKKSDADLDAQNEKLHQTLALTERRINTHQMEYNLLYYNLCSAKIFFQ